jgi:mycofactocin glycosyltransferase
VRYVVDRSWQRFTTTVLAGSPLRLLRVTPGGVGVLERIERGDDIEATGVVASLIDRLLDAGAVHPVRDPLRAPVFSAEHVTVVTPVLRGVGDDPTFTDGRITVDDGSTPPVSGSSLRLDVNGGPAAARNAARPLVSTPLVAFLDADVVVDPSWLDDLLWHFDDPRVGLVAPRVLGETGSPLDLGDEPARIRSGTRVSYVPGAALVVRVAALDDVGGFDPTLRFGEDVDLVWRLDEAGWRCRFEPAVSVWHEPRSTLLGRLRQHAGYGTSAAPLALRHPRRLSPVQFNGWTAIVWSAAASGHIVVATAVGIGSSLALVRKLPDLPASASVRLALRGHLMGGRQIATAARRAWWPILAVGMVASRRMRWIGLAAVLADVRAAPTDLAYAWGVWRGMLDRRTPAPITPRLTAWPGRRRHSSPTAVPGARPRRPDGDAR